MREGSPTVAQKTYAVDDRNHGHMVDFQNPSCQKSNSLVGSCAPYEHLKDFESGGNAPRDFGPLTPVFWPTVRPADALDPCN